MRSVLRTVLFSVTVRLWSTREKFSKTLFEWFYYHTRAIKISVLYDLNKDNFWYLSCIRHRENRGPDVEDIITKMGQWTRWKRVWTLNMPPSQSHLISILHCRCNFPSLLFSEYLPPLPSVHTPQSTCPPFLFRSSRSPMTIKQNKTSFHIKF